MLLSSQSDENLTSQSDENLTSQSDENLNLGSSPEGTRLRRFQK
jgi:hypothetical protein